MMEMSHFLSRYLPSTNPSRNMVVLRPPESQKPGKTPLLYANYVRYAFFGYNASIFSYIVIDIIE